MFAKELVRTSAALNAGCRAFWHQRKVAGVAIGEQAVVITAKTLDAETFLMLAALAALEGKSVAFGEQKADSPAPKAPSIGAVGDTIREMLDEG